jgi:hypothetical protein
MARAIREIPEGRSPKAEGSQSAKSLKAEGSRRKAEGGQSGKFLKAEGRRPKARNLRNP